MRIIVNHLTRMAHPYICVAGIDPETGAHIRPTMRGRLPRELLRSHGGPFDIAGLVDLGAVVAEGAPPEIEDHAFHHWGARYLETLDPARFWALSRAVAQPTFAAIFGPDLEVAGHSLALAAGKGLASLGVLTPARQPHLTITALHTLRLLVSDSAHDLALPVTDLRFFAEDHQTVCAHVVADVNRRLMAGVSALLAVGLSRPFQKDGESEARHWLQVNNLHLEDAPVWQAVE